MLETDREQERDELRRIIYQLTYKIFHHIILCDKRNVNGNLRC